MEAGVMTFVVHCTVLNSCLEFNFWPTLVNWEETAFFVGKFHPARQNKVFFFLILGIVQNDYEL